jgi:hypothetical protein
MARNSEAVLKIRKPFEEQADHGELDHSLGVLRNDLIVTIKAT